MNSPVHLDVKARGELCSDAGLCVPLLGPLQVPLGQNVFESVQLLCELPYPQL